MHDDGGEPGYGVDQCVLGADRDVVGRGAAVVVGVRPDGVPEAAPQPLAPGVMRVPVIGLVPVAVIMAVVARPRVVRIPHAPRMGWKSRCSTSTPATPVPLRIPRT
jgi:hypothetical protein